MTTPPGESQLRERLRSIVDNEGVTTVEPACLSEQSLTDTTFKGGVASHLPPRSLSSAPASAQSKGWLLLLVGCILGLILAGVVFVVCRPAPPKVGVVGVARKSVPLEINDELDGSLDYELDSELDGELDDELDDESGTTPPRIARAVAPPPSVPRPKPRRAARATADGGEPTDPMFQPLRGRHPDE